MSTRSPDVIAEELLAACRAGQPWQPESLRQLVESNAPQLFSHVVEPLCDAFDPVLCNRYAALFSEVIASQIPGLGAAALVERYQRIRRGRAWPDQAPKGVVVLSRVTLGADVAVTSLVLDWALRRFPSSHIWFAGPAKNYELFNAHPRIEHLPVAYGRRVTLRERFEAGLALRDTLPDEAVVLDPDSRITQLGLLPVCDESRYFFFESRSIVSGSISDGVRGWLGDAGARAFISPRAEPVAAGRVCVSLGTGENAAKRVGDPFEAELLRALVAGGHPLLVDHGAGGEEQERVDRAIAATGAHIDTWSGPFAPFAASIAKARMYVGYDSSGQHVAAACGTPLLTVFAGAPSARFAKRWRPSGPGRIEVLPAAADDDPSTVLGRALAAVSSLTGSAER